jgi:hypothetical protein
VRNVIRFRVRPFLAPFPDYLNIHLSVKLFVFTLISSRSSSLIAVATRRASQRATDESGILENRCCANFERSTSLNQNGAKPILARKAHDESRSLGLAMVMFSAGFPTGVEGHLPHLTQRTGFFSSLPGQATQLKPGHLEKLHCS